ncbi:MAG TPA: hypothetical protein VF816_06245 [Rhodocyclaceae bacterium]
MEMLAGGGYVTTEAAVRAVELVAPMIEAARGDAGVVGSGFLYVVVMDPALRPADVRFEEAILHERGFGDETRWDADYRSFARDKARLCWQYGMDGHRLQTLEPYRLRGGDSLLWGGVWLDGIAVGASGAFPAYDELFAGAVALGLRAMAKRAREAAIDSRLTTATGDGGSSPLRVPRPG